VNWPWLGAAVLGVVVTGASIIGAVRDDIAPWERRAFAAVNRLPSPLFYGFWPIMQLGNLAVGALAGLVVAWLAGRWDVALAVVVATGLKLVAEKVLRRELHGRIPARVRPGSSQPDAILRGDDIPREGPSFPSGHALLAMALACVVAPVLPLGWEVIPFALAALVAIGRVFVGAHNPLDVACGAGAGLIVGGIVGMVIA
jgi:membrane-associated phospholipid phosphatase